MVVRRVLIICMVLSLITAWSVDATTTEDTPPSSPNTTPAPVLKVCYSCRYIQSASQCHHAKRCRAGETCLYGVISDGGRNSYFLDCIPEPACGLSARLDTVGTVDFLSKQFSQFKCCSDERCNKQLINPADIAPVGK